jgi:predicted SAM-dependent methyltransferase
MSDSNPHPKAIVEAAKQDIAKLASEGKIPAEYAKQTLELLNKTKPVRVNLGCPIKCEGYLCVDLHPEEQGVIEADALEFLDEFDGELEEIYSKNMLEHITEINEFFLKCRKALMNGGKLTIITDNAEFIPFYMPFIHRWGFGAHSSNKYFHNYRYHRTGAHYAVFTKLHLRNIFERYGFEVKEVKRMTFGARILCSGSKSSFAGK